jgi:precorrin-6A/cobalt-precorrin-6A reductase
VIGHVLILGGTADARGLAGLLTADGVRVTTSLAGRTAAPHLAPGEARSGPFGGAEGLAQWLVSQSVDLLVDATHPFAIVISRAAVEACARTATPRVSLERPGWTWQRGDRWTRVATLRAAAAALPPGGRRVLLSIGRQEVAPFAGIDDAWFLIRSISAAPAPLPPHHLLLEARGPFTVAGELALLERHAIDVIVTKDSGGEATAAKLEAARALGLPVIMIDRPRAPAAQCAPDAGTAHRQVMALLAAATARGRGRSAAG